jgi:acetate---CoA ligase (ADP-forming)
VTVDALFRQAGVIRTDTLTALFDVAMLLTTQPLPRGRRVGILTNVGGPGTMCADACEGEGLEVPDLSEPLRSRLAALLPAEASVANPVDMLAAASADQYRRATGLLLASGEVDALMAIFIEPLATRPDEVAEALRAAVEAAGGPRARAGRAHDRGRRVGWPATRRHHDPSLCLPGERGRALAKVAEYGTWLFRPEGRLPNLPDTDREAAAAVLASALAEGGPRWLRPDEVARLLGCYGLPLADWRLASTPEEAGEAAAELGGTVALNAVTPTLVHKTEAGGVHVGLAGADRVARAAEDMAEAVAKAGHQVERFLVQRMVSGGVEMLVGVVDDPSFGPILACGGGGTAVELLKDLAVRITPITVDDADEMVRSLATLPLLDGYRSAPKADTAALKDVLLRVSAMVDAHPEIAELDCNPVLALPDGAMIVDARVQVRAARPPWPLAARRCCRRSTASQAAEAPQGGVRGDRPTIIERTSESVDSGSREPKGARDVRGRLPRTWAEELG